MRFKGLDINLLVALDALLTEQNVTRAGERINLTQSGMSGALSRLRDYFKDDLIVPTGREHVLTPLAESLIQPVRGVLLRVDAAILMRPYSSPVDDKRCYRLLVSEYTLTLLAPALVQRVAREAPQVTLSFSLLRENAVELLERGDVDLMLLPAGFRSPNHPYRVIFEESYQCAIWNENPWAETELTLEQYLQHGHIAVQHWPSGALMYEGRFLEERGISRRIEITTTSLTAPPQLVVGTDLIATVHSRLLAALGETLPLRVLPMPVTIPPLCQVAQWHRVRSNDAGLIWLRNMVEEEASKL